MKQNLIIRMMEERDCIQYLIRSYRSQDKRTETMQASGEWEDLAKTGIRIKKVKACGPQNGLIGICKRQNYKTIKLNASECLKQNF